MNKKHPPVLLPALLLVAASGVACAGDSQRMAQDPREPVVVANEYSAHSPFNVKTAHSDCQRHRVTWSGGIARRGFDRIRPRPTRSRWQDAGDNRIFCAGGDPFSQRRVAAEPWIR